MIFFVFFVILRKLSFFMLNLWRTSERIHNNTFWWLEKSSVICFNAHQCPPLTVEAQRTLTTGSIWPQKDEASTQCWAFFSYSPSLGDGGWTWLSGMDSIWFLLGMDSTLHTPAADSNSTWERTVTKIRWLNFSKVICGKFWFILYV